MYRDMGLVVSCGVCVELCAVNVKSSCETFFINLLTPNVDYSGRTAPLTSKVAFYIFIQQI